MRHFLLATATASLLWGPAFAGTPTVPAVPSVNIAVPTTNFTVNTFVDVNPGTSTNTMVHGGPVQLAQSLSLKMSTLIATSTSFSTAGINIGFTVP